ncbi:MAG: hypothetical protein RL220_731 [Bacteroidota bacterium]|jgi:hypothetical protein
MSQEVRPKDRIPGWLKKMGLAGFLFFFIKGLFWIAAAYFGVGFLKDC